MVSTQYSISAVIGALTLGYEVKMSKIFLTVILIFVASCHRVTDNNDTYTEDTMMRCQDKFDNDGDGLVDCADDGCQQFAFCSDTDTDSIVDEATDSDYGTGVGYETDSNTDTEYVDDTDTGGGTVDTSPCEEGVGDPSYTYPADCIGNECHTGSCCADATCGERYFGSIVQGFITNYCYPRPNPLATDRDPCQCGDLEVQWQPRQGGNQLWKACLPKGSLTSNSQVSFPIMSAEYLDNAPGGQLDMSDIRQFPATVLKTRINGLSSAQQPTFTMGFGLEDYVDLDGNGKEDDRVIYLIHQGVKGMSTVWMAQTMIPADKWSKGTLVDPESGTDKTRNFDTTLLRGTISGQYISNMWIEALAVQGEVILDSAPAVCDNKGGAGCGEAAVRYDLEFAAAKAELEMSEMD